MANWNTVRYSSLAEDQRLDTDYYIGPGSALRERFKKTGKPFDYFFARIAHPGEFTREYVPQGHLFLRAQNIRPGAIETDNPIYVDDDIYKSLPDAVAAANDILLVRTGANLADAARVSDRFTGSLVSSHTLRLIPKAGVPIHALGFLFCSDPGRSVLLSLRSGGTHGQINSFSLKSIFLPDLSPIEKKCEALAKEIENATDWQRNFTQKPKPNCWKEWAGRNWHKRPKKRAMFYLLRLSPMPSEVTPNISNRNTNACGLILRELERKRLGSFAPSQGAEFSQRSLKMAMCG
jgi:hypothetical protein